MLPLDGPVLQGTTNTSTTPSVPAGHDVRDAAIVRLMRTVEVKISYLFLPLSYHSLLAL